MPKKKVTSPTQAEIDAEIAELKRLRPLIRPTTFFGDSNTAAIDAEIETLEQHFTHDNIYNHWPREEEDLRLRDHALEALEWLTDGGDTPSSSWASLVVGAA